MLYVGRELTEKAKLKIESITPVSIENVEVNVELSNKYGSVTTETNVFWGTSFDEKDLKKLVGTQVEAYLIWRGYSEIKKIVEHAKRVQQKTHSFIEGEIIDMQNIDNIILDDENQHILTQSPEIYRMLLDCGILLHVDTLKSQTFLIGDYVRLDRGGPHLVKMCLI